MWPSIMCAIILVLYSTLISVGQNLVLGGHISKDIALLCFVSWGFISVIACLTIICCIITRDK